MSTLLEQASLVMIPSGYKEDVVYSQIPTNGNGDLSFTRASNGTRVNSAGLVEVCPWNDVEYSEDFTNAFWDKTGTITADAGVAPNGTTTADKLAAGTSNLIRKPMPTIAGQTYTGSVYIKSANAGQSASLRLNMSIGQSTPAVSIPITTTDEWQRFTATYTTTDTTTFFQIGEWSTLGYGPTNDILIWGAQLNIGATAKPYFPTTDRLNVPRLTYQNGGGGCPSLLLEKQSTNLLSYSEDFGNAYWLKFNGTISTNTTTSPDGTQNADSLVSDSGQYGVLFISAQFTVGQNVTLSIFAKANTSSTIRLGTTDAGVDYSGVFNLSNGTITSSTGVTSSIQSMGNGWYRCIVNRTMAGNANMFAVEQEAGKSLYIWGAQAEVSSYPTSYIPTTNASATRVKDNCVKTGVSSLIGQSEGTVFVEFKMNGQSFGEDIYSNNKNLTGSISIQVAINGQLAGFICYSGSFIQIASSTGTIQIGQTYKVAIAYKTGDSALYLNGVQIGTSTAAFAFTTTLSEIDIANDAVFFANLNSKNINEVVQFKTRLTNAELASLTTI